MLEGYTLMKEVSGRQSISVQFLESTQRVSGALKRHPVQVGGGRGESDSASWAA